MPGSRLNGGRMKIVILDADTFLYPDAAPWAPLKAFGEVVLHGVTDQKNEALIAERCAGAEVVLTNKVPLSKTVLEQLPQLKLISVLATGYNIIDVAAAKACGVTVCNVPGYSTNFVAQHTVALILALCNRTAPLDAWVRDGNWTKSKTFTWWDRDLAELDGLTVGIVGLGTIGRKVGQAVTALGCKVLGNTRSRKDPPSWPGFAWADVEAIFEIADIVTLHCPQTAENAQFVNAALLAKMKPSAFLINTARGGLINEADLREALENGTIAGAALDVVTTEPMRADCPLLGAPNCIITPHVAWSSGPSRQRLLDATLANIRCFIEGVPQNVVG